MNMNVSTAEQFGVQWLETMKKKIDKTHIAITLQLVVDSQRTIGTPQRDGGSKLVQ